MHCSVHTAPRTEAGRVAQHYQFEGSTTICCTSLKLNDALVRTKYLVRKGQDHHSFLLRRAENCHHQETTSQARIGLRRNYKVLNYFIVMFNKYLGVKSGSNNKNTLRTKRLKDDLQTASFAGGAPRTAVK